MNPQSLAGSYYPPEEIIKKVSIITRIPVEAIKSSTRKRKVVTARQIAMYFILKLTRLNEVQTGQIFGGRDHSTVNWSRKTVITLVQVDKDYRKLYEEINEELCRQVS